MNGDEKIWQEPKIAMQIINKILQGVDGKGVTVNVITIGKLVVTMNGKEIVTETLEAVEAKVIDGPEAKTLLKTEPIPQIDNQMKYPQSDFKSHRSKEETPYSDFIDSVVKTGNPNWLEHSTSQAGSIVRKFFRYLFKQKGMFRLEEIGQEDLMAYLKSRIQNGNKGASVRAEKWYISKFFKDLEKQGIGKAIPKFIFYKLPVAEQQPKDIGIPGVDYSLFPV